MPQFALPLATGDAMVALNGKGGLFTDPLVLVVLFPSLASAEPEQKSGQRLMTRHRSDWVVL